jgi:nicotinamidase-related amidase
MSIYYENKHTVHMPVDPQRRFYTKLSAERYAAFPREIDDFSRALASLGIETLPVAFEYNSIGPGLYKRPFPKNPWGRNFFNALTLSTNFFPFAVNKIYVKDVDNAFNEDNALATEIENRDIKTIIVTGMNSTVCVPQTIKGALEECKKLCVEVVYDRLASEHISASDEGNPLCHKDALESRLRRYGKDIAESPRLSLVTSEQVLKQYSPQNDVVLQTPLTLRQRTSKLLTFST